MEKENVSDQARSVSSPNEPNSSVKDDYSAQDVADAFVKQYYNILQDSPQDAHRFYKDKSILAYPCPDGSMKSATTLKDIDNELTGSNIKEWNPNLTTVHAQDSVMGSVIVGVTGFLTDNDNVTKHFAHTFCLAPQEGGGFYVHNDFLQLIEVNKISETSPPLDADAAAASPQISPQAIDKAKDSPKKDEIKVANSSKGKNPLPTEPNKKSQSLNIEEDAKRVSYASVVAKEGPVTPPPQTLPNADRQSSLSLPKQNVRPLTLPSNDVLESIYDVKSIRVKDLPPKMTEESLLEVVKRFGPVKNKNIQIKEYSQDGYRYAFVEFENPKSARTAVEARFIHFEDRELEIQYKRHYNQGGHNNYMGRGSWTGRGGFHDRDRDSDWRSGGSSGSWGNRYNYNNDHEYNNNYNRRNRYFQDQSRSFN